MAPELGPALEEVRDGLGIEPCYHDPGVAEFGLENVLFPIGDQFLEIVAPVQEGTTAGRTLERRGGAGGYMVMVQCDDLDRRRARLADLGARVIWQGDYPDIRGTHVHPKDIGGAIVSVDEATPWESWRWAGPAWRRPRPHGDGDRGALADDRRGRREGHGRPLGRGARPAPGRRRRRSPPTTPPSRSRRPARAARGWTRWRSRRPIARGWGRRSTCAGCASASCDAVGVGQGPLPPRPR